MPSWTRHGLFMLFVFLEFTVVNKANVKPTTDRHTSIVDHASLHYARARKMCDMFVDLRVPCDKILYKIMCTWEGVQAVGILESEGIACHVTHVFCLEQAAAAARVNASLIQVYPGRVKIWYDAQPEQAVTNHLDGAENPGEEHDLVWLLIRGGEDPSLL